MDDEDQLLRIVLCPTEDLLLQYWTGLDSNQSYDTFASPDKSRSIDVLSEFNLKLGYSNLQHSDRANSLGVESSWAINDSAAHNTEYYYDETQPVTHSKASYNIYREIEDVINSILVVCVCVFGLIGNLLNIAILSYRCVKCDLGRMEKFALSGLIGLAATDLIFCVLVLPHSFVNHHEIGYTSLSFNLLYTAYCGVVINVCILCSILLIVSLAVGRYMVILHPIRAREVLGMTFARRMILGIVLFSITANLPRIWMSTVRDVTCYDGSRVYYLGKRESYTTLETLYLISYFAIAICVPFLVLVYCNIYLLRALKHTASLATHGNRHSFTNNNYRLTLCLVVIIIALLLLVMPGEILTFLKDIITSQNADYFNFPLAVGSLLQAINFSFNFLLYCFINTSFRRSLMTLLRCRQKGAHKSRSSVSARLESATAYTILNAPASAHSPTSARLDMELTDSKHIDNLGGV